MLVMAATGVGVFVDGGSLEVLELKAGVGGLIGAKMAIVELAFVGAAVLSLGLAAI